MIDDLSHDVGLLRSVLARELATINHYRTLAERAEEGAARDFLLHITEEEKIHVADILQAIARFDADQARLLAAGFAPDHAPGEVPSLEPQRMAESRAEPRTRETSPKPPRIGQELTVGSLRHVAQEP